MDRRRDHRAVLVLWQIRAPHFTAGFVIDKDIATRECAPILKKWIIGKRIDWIANYCSSKGWQIVWVADLRAALT